MAAHLPNRWAYSAISWMLQKHGYARKDHQIHTKWKAMKKAFYDDMQAWGVTPAHLATPPHFQELHQLWQKAGQPRWADRHPDSATAHQRAAVPPRDVGQAEASPTKGAEETKLEQGAKEGDLGEGPSGTAGAAKELAISTSQMPL
uniref:Uncharacterized protein n=1 Tax=Sphaerodactylus townsendi TaxID=933632 RepID=A0ACB8GBD6_9SAUR